MNSKEIRLKIKPRKINIPIIQEKTINNDELKLQLKKELEKDLIEKFKIKQQKKPINIRLFLKPSNKPNMKIEEEINKLREELKIDLKKNIEEKQQEHLEEMPMQPSPSPVPVNQTLKEIVYVPEERHDFNPDEVGFQFAKTVRGFTIPNIKNVGIMKVSDIKQNMLIELNLKYPLIPNKPKQGEPVYAYANIFWDDKNNEFIYKVIEPELTKDETEKLNEIKNYLEEKIDIKFSYIRKKEAIDYIEKMFSVAVNYFRIKPEIVNKLRYYVIRDFVGLEKLEPVLNDDQIEDISCDGVGIPLYVYHRDPRIASVKTNIIFNDKEELDNFVIKISEKCGKTISTSKPLLDATLPDNSRVQATLGSDIARRGSNFTIRKFTENPLTPVDLISYNTVDLKIMSLLWLCIEYGSSILISGGTATGKTSLLNVLSLFIKPQMKIISIEDTAELRLPHPHWVPEVARSVIAESGSVDMYELLRESLRQRPDYIILGETRGKEAYVLFQQIATGHPALSTIHAENFSKLMDRLTTEPIDLPANLIENLDIILFLKRVKQRGRYLRRLDDVIEVVGYNRKSNMPVINEIFKWDSRTDDYQISGKSYVLRKISETSGMNEDEIQKNLQNRAKILEWMFKHNIKDYKKVGKIINLFYTNPDFLLERISKT